MPRTSNHQRGRSRPGPMTQPRAPVVPSLRRTQSVAAETSRLTPKLDTEVWLWAACIFLLTVPFAFQLTGTDPSYDLARNASTGRRAAEGSGAILYVMRLAITVLASISVIPLMKHVAARVAGLTPMIVFFGWATISVLWSYSFESTLYSVIGLFLLITTGFFISVRLSPNRLARAVIYSGLIMAITSFAWAIVMPKYGVHQFSDTSQSVHAGAWRGVYLHKNNLGGISGLYAVAILFCGPNVIKSRILKVGLFFAFLMLVIKSSSATGLVVLIIAPPVTLLLLALSGVRRVITLTFTVIGGVFATLAIPPFLAMLGRDMTFTGRTEIWAYAPASIASAPLLGRGFSSTTYGEFTYNINQKFGVWDPHSGYLDLLLGTGFTGLALYLACIYFAWRKARALYLSNSGMRHATLILFSAVISWQIVNLGESGVKPLGVVAGLGFLALNLMAYPVYSRRPSTAASGERRRQPVRPYRPHGAASASHAVDGIDPSPTP